MSQAIRASSTRVVLSVISSTAPGREEREDDHSDCSEPVGKHPTTIKNSMAGTELGLLCANQFYHLPTMGPGASDGKVSACNVGDLGSIPGLGRSPGEGNGNPLQYFAWKIPWIEEPGSLQSMGLQRVDMTEQLHLLPTL